MYITCNLQAYPVMDAVNPFHKACSFIDGRCETLLSFLSFPFFSIVLHLIIDSRHANCIFYNIVSLGNQPQVSLTPLFNLQAGRLQMEMTGLVTAAKEQKRMLHPSNPHCNNLGRHLLPDQTRTHLPHSPTNSSLEFKRILEVISVPC